MNAVIQAAEFDARAPLSVAGGTAADERPPYKTYYLAGGLQAWVQYGDAFDNTVQQLIQAAGGGYIFYVCQTDRYENNPMFHLHFCPVSAVSLLPPGTLPAARSIAILAAGEWLDAFFNSALKTAAMHRQLQNLPGWAYRQPMPAGWEFLAVQILEGQGNLLFTMNRLLLLFEKFMNRMTRLLDEPAGIAVYPDCELDRLRQTEQELRKTLCGPAPTISQLARKAAMSPTKLKKLFRDVYGAPIYQYYQKMRMRHARQLLESGDYTVKEAGLKIGYTNLSHFSGAFKKEFGLLPSQLTFGREVQEFTYKVLE